MASKREELWRKQGGLCFYCERVMTKTHEPRNKSDGWALTCASSTLDHKVPRVAGGGNEIANLCLACFRCNSLKGDMDWVAFITLWEGRPMPEIDPQKGRWRGTVYQRKTVSARIAPINKQAIKVTLRDVWPRTGSDEPR
jgi:hypothetical protein